MSEHRVTVDWRRRTPDFSYPTYNRDHTWVFEGGAVVEASAAPGYKGNAEKVDPEEAFVAALSSCHMLTFLALCTKKKLIVDRYVDHAVGTLGKNQQGEQAVTRVVLRPEITFGEGGSPSSADLETLHHDAHDLCFIANSVTTEVTVESPVRR